MFIYYMFEKYEQKELLKDLLEVLVKKGIITSEEQIELQSHLY